MHSPGRGVCASEGLLSMMAFSLKWRIQARPLGSRGAGAKVGRLQGAAWEGGLKGLTWAFGVLNCRDRETEAGAERTL